MSLLALDAPPVKPLHTVVVLVLLGADSFITAQVRSFSSKEVMVMARLSYVGLKHLSNDEADLLKSLVEHHAEKIDFLVRDAEIEVHVKVPQKQGKSLYFLDCKLSTSHLHLGAADSGRDFRQVVHGVMEKLSNATKKRLHSGAQPQERFHPESGSRGTEDVHMKEKARGFFARWLGNK